MLKFNELNPAIAYADLSRIVFDPGPTPCQEMHLY